MTETDAPRAIRAPIATDLRRFVARPWRFAAAASAALSGALLSTAFPPLDFGIVAWVALVPFLLLPPPRRTATQAVRGFMLGAAHFLTCLFWLTTVTWAGWGLLSLTCALFPMLWAVLCLPMFRVMHGHRPFPGTGGRRAPNGAVRVAAILLSAAVWCALEWLRSTVFTGFPWNLLGGSQWRSALLLATTAVTGVYGLSFVLVAANTAIAAGLRRWAIAFLRGGTRGVPWESLTAVVVCAAALWMGLTAPRLGTPRGALRTAAVQGCLPQARQWTPEQLAQGLEVYDRLSRTAARLPARPDLIVWPETAVPAPLRWEESYASMFRKLLADTSTWFLIGTIDYRFPTGTGPHVEPNVFNSAFLFGPRGQLRDSYDKTHPVPFGEYTPFGRYLPWLERWIGMGRSLTAGVEYTVLRLPKQVRAGVNICYEDVFPRISREFVRRGANLLVTLTNDAWYAESAGSAQHLSHAVLRAAENRRPLLRSGNNSDTCLILPDGRVTALLRDPVTGNRFLRGVQTIQVPVWQDPPLTFYTRHGDWFACLCALAAGLWGLALAARELHRRAVLRARVLGTEAPRQVPRGASTRNRNDH